MALTEIIVEHWVEFSETDAAGLVHFSNYYRYMEKAERVLFSTAGLTLLDDQGLVVMGWPRVRAKCDFCAPLRFGDRVSIHLSIIELSRQAIRYSFRFNRNSPEDGTLVARGEMTTLSAQMERSSKSMRAFPASELLLERLAIHTPSPTEDATQ